MGYRYIFFRSILKINSIRTSVIETHALTFKNNRHFCYLIRLRFAASEHIKLRSFEFLVRMHSLSLSLFLSEHTPICVKCRSKLHVRLHLFGCANDYRTIIINKIGTKCYRLLYLDRSNKCVETYWLIVRCFYCFALYCVGPRERSDYYSMHQFIVILVLAFFFPLCSQLDGRELARFTNVQ